MKGVRVGEVVRVVTALRNPSKVLLHAPITTSTTLATVDAPE
jgi:hypothetical protein